MENQYFSKVKSTESNNSLPLFTQEDCETNCDANKWINDLMQTVEENNRLILFKNAENESIKLVLNMYRRFGDPSEYEKKFKELSELREKFDVERENYIKEIDNLKKALEEEKKKEMTVFKEEADKTKKECDEYKYLTNRLNDEIKQYQKDFQELSDNYNEQTKSLLILEKEKNELYENNSSIQNKMKDLYDEISKYENKLQDTEVAMKDTKSLLYQSEQNNLRVKEELQHYQNLKQQLCMGDIQEETVKLRKKSELILEENKLQLKKIDQFNDLKVEFAKRQSFRKNDDFFFNNKFNIQLNMNESEVKFDDEICRLENTLNLIEKINKEIYFDLSQKVVRTKTSMDIFDSTFKNPLHKKTNSEMEDSVFLNTLKNAIQENSSIKARQEESDQKISAEFEKDSEKKEEKIESNNDFQITSFTLYGNNEDLRVDRAKSHFNNPNNPIKSMQKGSFYLDDEINESQILKPNTFIDLDDPDRNHRKIKKDELKINDETLSNIHKTIVKNLNYLEKKRANYQKMKENFENFTKEDFENEINAESKFLGELIENTNDCKNFITSLQSILEEHKSQIYNLNNEIFFLNSKISKISTQTNEETEEYKKSLEENLKIFTKMIDQEKIEKINQSTVMIEKFKIAVEAVVGQQNNYKTQSNELKDASGNYQNLEKSYKNLKRENQELHLKLSLLMQKEKKKKIEISHTSSNFKKNNSYSLATANMSPPTDAVKEDYYPDMETIIKELEVEKNKKGIPLDSNEKPNDFPTLFHQTYFNLKKLEDNLKNFAILFKKLDFH